MSVKIEVHKPQAEAIKLSELDEQELMVLKLFRMLNDEQRKDIIRFINVLVSLK
jgi:hypothetical protein